MEEPVVIKKRKRPPLRQPLHASGNDDKVAGDEGAAGSWTDNSESGIAIDLEDARELQRLRRRTAGISVDKLMEADGYEDRPATPKPNDDPFKLKSGGGLIDASMPLSGAFTKQTNTLDVDKHMVAYVEQEMRKRRGKVDENVGDATADPLAELYKLPESVTKLLKPKDDAAGDEGTATTSAAMLMSIPEIDLGIQAKVKNIEDTERAKQALKTTEPGPPPINPDYLFTEHERRMAIQMNSSARREDLATDDIVLERFKKREMMYRMQRR